MQIAFVGKGDSGKLQCKLRYCCEDQLSTALVAAVRLN